MIKIHYIHDYIHINKRILKMKYILEKRAHVGITEIIMNGIGYNWISESFEKV